jgi:hypothetical protein
MVQINDDNFEDLTEESMGAVLDALAAAIRSSRARRSAPDQLPRRRPDQPQEDGRAQLRLSPHVGRSGGGRLSGRFRHRHHRRGHRRFLVFKFIKG